MSTRPNNPHSNETERVLAKWQAIQGQINACKRCVHGRQSEGRICNYGVSVRTEVARASGGRCGPEAALLYIPNVVGETKCVKCLRPLFGVGCCHC